MRIKTNEERFWPNVVIIPEHSCWEWIGAKDRDGYGKLHIGNHRYMRAHRFSVSLRETLDRKKVIDHICKNRSCVNPLHLRQVTWAVNTIENSVSVSALNKIKTHCKNGHEFNIVNTKIRVDGTGRRCIKCHKENSRKLYLQKCKK